MPFFWYVLYFKKKILPPSKCFGNSILEEVISSWENKGNAFTKKLSGFMLYYYQEFIFNQDKVVLFSSKQMISSSLPSLLLLRNLLFVSARHHLSSLCKLLSWILIAALWSRLVGCTIVSIWQRENWDVMRSCKWWSQDAKCSVLLISYPNSNNSQGAIQELSWVPRPLQGIHKITTVW